MKPLKITANPTKGCPHIKPPPRAVTPLPQNTENYLSTVSALITDIRSQDNKITNTNVLNSIYTPPHTTCLPPQSTTAAPTARPPLKPPTAPAPRARPPYPPSRKSETRNLCPPPTITEHAVHASSFLSNMAGDHISSLRWTCIRVQLAPHLYRANYSSPPSWTWSPMHLWTFWMWESSYCSANITPHFYHVT